MADRSNPINAEQLRLVLQVVAGRADAARQVLIHAGDDHAVLLAAAEAAIVIITSIGAMADDNSGSPAIGNADRWNFGPNFASASAGVEVDHG